MLLDGLRVNQMNLRPVAADPDPSNRFKPGWFYTRLHGHGRLPKSQSMYFEDGENGLKFKGINMVRCIR